MSELMRQYHVDYFVNGHDHSHEETTYKNVKYYTIGAMKDSRLGFAAYMTMTFYGGVSGKDEAPIEVILHRMSGEEYYGAEDLIPWDEEED